MRSLRPSGSGEPNRRALLAPGADFEGAAAHPDIALGIAAVDAAVAEDRRQIGAVVVRGSVTSVGAVWAWAGAGAGEKQCGQASG